MAYLPNRVRIEGHTCDLPIHTARYPSNWELSAQRAINVLTYLVRKGIDPSRLSAVGYADTRPIVPNIDEEHRRKNRRVDIVIEGALDKHTMQLIHRKLGLPTIEKGSVGLSKVDIRPKLNREVASDLQDTD